MLESKCTECGGVECHANNCRQLDDTRYPVCPYCGYEWRNAGEAPWSNNGDTLFNDCGRCGEEYEVELVLTVAYSTSQIKKSAS